METTADQNLQKDVFVAGWGATNERGRDPADALQKLNVPLFPGKDTNQIGGHSTTTWTKFDPILTPSPLK